MLASFRRSKNGGSYVAVPSKVLKQLYLSQSPLCQNFFAENIGDFLDGYPLTGLIIGSGTGAIHVSQCSYHGNQDTR